MPQPRRVRPASLVIESDQRVTAGAIALDGGTVDKDDVQAAIIVAVEKADTAAGGVNDVAGFGSGDMGSGETHVFRDVFESGNRRQAAAVFLLLRSALRRWRDGHRNL